MAVRYLSRADVMKLAQDMDCEAALRAVLLAEHAGMAGQEVRQEMRAAALNGVIGLMPSWSAGEDSALAAKTVCVMPGNPALGLPAHQGIVTLFDGTTGAVKGLAEAGAVTEIRTAAMAALATRTLAASREGAVSLVVGAGHQTLPHLQALARVPGVTRHLIWARRAEATAPVVHAARVMGLTVEAVVDLPTAAAVADVVTLVTSAAQPVLRAEWLRPGTHVNAMGSSTHRVREFGPDLLRRAGIFADHIPSVRALAGEFADQLDTLPMTALAAVLAEQGASPSPAGDITLFKSVGMALQDLAVLQPLLALAETRGLGQSITP
ncbi:MAG: ornithine cyclodeaminase family protein [Rhodobacteraceae bacterium]|jgi:ornithine cyclodeaminase/alanine dehydrogenase-like protein (mu-crystallin family)|nr:ornithine cyclodeaminase family protein [Paracoccaceae bacterium]